eukprot:CAMPEP_0117539280 /NCGR_PEP_ID=MMETSP0784-20121206/42905_1 /TAXON_ID=39447 /ORGANISM="" /LENGTH=206 /DNA_ID=CAMNT_0005335905 /DNA_START=280 /DNA_END=900 /DNA_ORIENTATION=+
MPCGSGDGIGPVVEPFHKLEGEGCSPFRHSASSAGGRGGGGLPLRLVKSTKRPRSSTGSKKHPSLQLSLFASALTNDDMQARNKHSSVDDPSMIEYSEEPEDSRVWLPAHRIGDASPESTWVTSFEAPRKLLTPTSHKGSPQGASSSPGTLRAARSTPNLRVLAVKITPQVAPRPGAVTSPVQGTSTRRRRNQFPPKAGPPPRGTS